MLEITYALLAWVLGCVFGFWMASVFSILNRGRSFALVGGHPPIKGVGESFRATLNGPFYEQVSLLSVAGPHLKVRSLSKPNRIGTVVLEQVHPEDRERVNLMAAAHPTSRDEYVFED